MLKLLDITLIGNILSAFVEIVEMNPRTFEIAIDITTGDIVKNTFGEVEMNVRMAASKLRELSKLGDKIPKTSMSAWY